MMSIRKQLNKHTCNCLLNLGSNWTVSDTRFKKQQYLTNSQCAVVISFDALYSTCFIRLRWWQHESLDLGVVMSLTYTFFRRASCSGKQLQMWASLAISKIGNSDSVSTQSRILLFKVLYLIIKSKTCLKLVLLLSLSLLSSMIRRNSTIYMGTQSYFFYWLERAVQLQRRSSAMCGDS